MRVFIDYHHFALGRSLLNVLCGRLGHEVRLADHAFAQRFPETKWGVFYDDMLDSHGFSPYRKGWPTHGVMSFEEFCDTEFDVLVCSRTEGQATLAELRDKFHPNARLIAQAGNEGMPYDWETYPNLMSSDNFTYEAAAGHVHKILYPQELGWYFGNEYHPITEASQRSIACYVNAFSGMNKVSFILKDYDTGNCPHCDRLVGVDEIVHLPSYWRKLQDDLPDHTFDLYGFENIIDGGRHLSEIELLSALRDHALTFHFKMHEGYGHSICQSVISGRPVIVPKRFFAYRFARRALIPDLTCIEVDLSSPEDAVQRILEVTDDLETLQRMSKRCWDIGQALFDWDHEAFRIARFLDDLQ